MSTMAINPTTGQLDMLGVFDGSGYVQKAGDTMTGALTVADQLNIQKTGEPASTATVEVIVDPANPASRSLQFVPPVASSRVYFGTPIKNIYALNFQNVLQIESMPAFQTSSGLQVGTKQNTFINRGGGGTEIGANHPDGYGLDVFQDNSFDTATLAHRALNVHRTSGVTYFGTSVDRANYEGVNIGYSAGAFHMWSVKAGTGTIRPMAFGYNGVENIRFDNTGTKITGGAGNVYISGLPTSNPGPGILWNNAGTPAIGT